MKREKNFYYFLVMIIYIICFTTSFIIGFRTVSIGNLTPSASFIVYPMTYFLAILFAERYSKKETIILFHYATFALIISVLFITISSTLNVLNGIDGLEMIFNMDYRIMFAYITSFYLSQFINLEVYYYITGFRGFKFLISSVIASTIDSLVFVVLAYVGTFSFDALIQRFTSQYVVNVFMVIIYTILFTYTIDTLIKTRDEKQISEQTKEKEKTKKITKKNNLKEKNEPSKKQTVKKTKIDKK